MDELLGEVVSAAIWAGAFLAALLVYRRPVADFFAARRDRIAVEVAERQVAVREREQQAFLNEQASAERALAHKADLRRKAAESDTAAEVTKATTAARIREEEQVIAARTEGRALRAKETALQTPEGASRFDTLVRAYETYRNTGGHQSFETWLGDLDINDFT